MMMNGHGKQWNGNDNQKWNQETAGTGGQYYPADGPAHGQAPGRNQEQSENNASRAPPPMPTKLLRKDSYGDSPFVSPSTPSDSLGPAVAPVLPAPLPGAAPLQPLHSLPLHSPALLPLGATPAMGPSPALSFEVLRPHPHQIPSKATSPPPPRVPPPPPPNDNFPGLGSPRLVDEDLSDFLGKARIWSASTMEPEASGQSKKHAEPGKPPTINYKGELNHIAQHVLKQPLTGKDVVFLSESDEDGVFRSQTGFVRKKDAEQRAAEVAVRELVREGVAP